MLEPNKLKFLLDKLVLEPKVFVCNLYINEEGDEGAATAIVVPTKIRVIGDGVQVVWSCSLIDSCRQLKCVYSRHLTPRRSLE